MLSFFQLQERVLQKQEMLQSGEMGRDLSSVVVSKRIQTFPFAQEISKMLLRLKKGDKYILSTSSRQPGPI